MQCRSGKSCIFMKHNDGVKTNSTLLFFPHYSCEFIPDRYGLAQPKNPKVSVRREI